MKILKSSEKKKIMKKLDEQFGIKNFPYLLLKFGKEKLRIYSGNLSREELMKFDKEFRVETVGMYFAIESNEEIRLSFDAVSLLRDEIKKNIIDINDKQAKEWMIGRDLDIKYNSTFVVLRNNEMLIGCGKSNGERIINYIPKERRVNG